jgi:tripartite-type tricarboxylate transporter receptor subunit TctC
MTIAAVRMALTLGLALTGGGHSAQAQNDYPNRPIRLVVGFAAGGPTDIPARYIAEKLGDRLGQRVVVENKPGAGGMLATREVLAQPRDGHNLLLCTHFEPINTAVYRNPQFKLTDLAPISLTSKYFYGITITNALPAKDWDSFARHAKANPGKISSATVGAGSPAEIFALQLERLTGISMTRVPYRGATPVIQDLLPGRVQFYVAPTASVLPLALTKELNVIAITSAERIAAAPDVPTLREKGIDFVHFAWLGFCAAAGTPEPIVALLNKHLREIIATPEYRKLIEDTGSIPESSTPAELRAIMDQTFEELAPTIKEFGLQRD